MLGWQEKRSGIFGTPGLLAWASKSSARILVLLVITVTSMTIPFSLPTVSLNWAIRRFMGESA